MNPEEILNITGGLMLVYGPKLILVIAVWIIGGWLIKGIVRGFTKMLEKSGTDLTLKPFLTGIVSAILKVMLIISVLGMLGIEMTSFIAILGAAGLAVGLALSGTLQNFAGGVMILIFKPFKAGDVIEAQGFKGSVHEIQIFNTILKTPDNKTIIIPNGGLSTSSMVNYSTDLTKRVDWTIGIAYGDDVDQARAVIKKLCSEDSRILPAPEVLIAVCELGDSSVNFTVRAWVEAADYWNVFFEMNEKVYKTFALEGINIPYPQMDVHLHNNE